MKIQDCQMDIACHHRANEERRSSTSTRVVEGKWLNFSDLVKNYRQDEAISPQSQPVTLDIEGQIPASWRSATVSGKTERQQRLELLLQNILAKLFALLTSQQEKPDDTTLPALSDASMTSQTPRESPTSPPGQLKVTQWQTERSEQFQESESTTVVAHGQLCTTDGRRIDFQLNVAMQRSFQVQYTAREAGRQVVLKDPLVINFDGKAAELSSTRFQFDLDGDGQRESVAGLGQNSAFLALDRNGDDRINDGTELFGAQSGDGFAELKAYDQDGNHWIDEADAIYSQLRIWQPASTTTSPERLQTLRQAGVGALWLGAVDSPFSIKDANNQLQGQIRQTGVWLGENGRAQVMQQVDLSSTD